MHSFIATAFALAIAGVASAQSIDPNSVPLSTRQTWCDSQKTACPLLCLQITPSDSTEANNCSAESLTYSCVCDNGKSPNASEFSQTLPYFICTEYDNQCVNNCAGNSACQSACRSDHPCGAQSPKRVNTTTSSTMHATKTRGSAAASTGSQGAVYTGFAGGAAATTSAGKGGNKSSSAALALSLGQTYGLGVVAAGIFVGFGLVL